tara:strand:- start:212 stop:808 length:597 start_codon:yes stop_codon:yes gene_type:complete
MESISNTVKRQSLPSLPSEMPDINGKSGSMFYLKIGVIIIIFAILGFNIFTNLGYITDQLAFIIKPVTKFFASLAGSATKTAVKTSTAGTRLLADEIDKTVDAVDDAVDETPEIKLPSVKKLSNNVGQDYSVPSIRDTVPKPDESNSQVQQGVVGKKGFCYIGNWNGFRSCVKVTKSNKCLSGEIFETDQQCRNPELR